MKEVFHSMGRARGRKGILVVKLDLKKAYDRLEWSFIQETLLEAGVPQPLADLIMIQKPQPAHPQISITYASSLSIAKPRMGSSHPTYLPRSFRWIRIPTTSTINHAGLSFTMETHRLLNLPSPSPAPLPLNPNPNRTTSHPHKPSPTNLRRCSATSRRPFGDSNAEGVRTGRFEFRDEEPVRFEGSRARRKWWYDDDEDQDEEEEEEDDDDEEGFGVWEEASGGLDWIFKLLRAFGWMLPAVIISLLVGTPNTLIMALALPLGQSAISLVLDKLWAVSGYREKGSRSRAKRNPFARASSRTQARERTRERGPGTSQQPRSYQSWTSMNHGTAKHGGRGRMNFRGWDELDKKGGESGDVFREKKVQDDTRDEYLPRQQTNGKLSRRRNREKPLFFRLLIAVFPFLGSWTRLFL
ncbi:hypothetical protein AKJ16_DCAP14354 [Drosera capensis]